MQPKVLIFDNAQEVAKHVAEILKSELKKKSSLVLGLPTGKTTLPIYDEFVRIEGKKEIDFSKIKTFNLDEYVGYSRQHKNSFCKFMQKNLFEKIKIPKENTNFLDGTAQNTMQECEKYEEKIKKAGGLDLTLLGLGVNGHIAFNEPGSDFNFRTREIVLHYQTRRSNFGLLHFVTAPSSALTMGIATILDSKKIILVAMGKHKARAVKAMLGKPDTKCPASALQNHKDVLVLLDKGAARLLKEKA